jgi:hypothetical protein
MREVDVVLECDDGTTVGIEVKAIGESHRDGNCGLKKNVGGRGWQ